jgi:streptomycin 3"-adenylyltransferase
VRSRSTNAPYERREEITMQVGWRNCPANIRNQVEQLTGGLGELLGANLLGVYLHGSLAMGSFAPGQSDIDVLIVTRDSMDEDTRRCVGALLLHLSGSPAPIEISFLRQSDMLPWRYPTPFDLHYSEMWRAHVARDLQTGAWPAWRAPQHGDPDLAAHITVTQQRGVCLYGAPISSVFPPVPRGDYIDSIMKDVDEGLSMINNNPVYAVLNACRTLAFLREGQVLSKDEGGVWALQHAPAALHGVITAALAAYRGTHAAPQLQPQALDDFAAMLQKLLHAESIP